MSLNFVVIFSKLFRIVKTQTAYDHVMFRLHLTTLIVDMLCFRAAQHLPKTATAQCACRENGTESALDFSLVQRRLLLQP